MKGVLAGRGEAVLYLDFDGVLHHESVVRSPRGRVYLGAPDGYSLFQHVGLLEDILAPYPELRIVLSTSWVRVLRFSRALKRLPLSLQARVIGATYHTEMHEGAFAHLPRAQQILDDVERRQPWDWLALDDEYCDWPSAHRERLVRTDPHEGISAPEVLAERKAKLKRLAGSAG